jgi:Flp pilus assembly protein TadD
MELGDILLAQNRPREAAVEFQDALKLDPNGELIHSRLAKALARQGSVQDAVKEFAQCIRLKPDDAEPHALLAGLLAGQGRTAEAISHYQQSLRLQPNSAETLNNLAWMLATDPHADLRDGPEAVRLASRACELTHDKMPLAVGTLAAAYAEAGRFDEAAATAQKAHDLALAAGNQQVAAKNLELLKLYISHHPFHQNP